MEILQNIPVDLDGETILSQAHIKAESKNGKDLLKLIETLRPYIKPKAMYQVCYIQNRQPDAIEFGGVWFTSHILSVNLEHTERVFPFIVTAGTELEEFTQQYTDILHRYWGDIVKETVLRSAVQYLRDYLKQRYALTHIAVMNPGSLTDWPIKEQKSLFSLFGDVQQHIGVKLTESFLMYPVKSVSGIIFPTEVTFVNCQLCPREDCPSRRAPYDEMLLNTKYSKQATVSSNLEDRAQYWEKL